jgi:hypothetical protein
MKCIIQRISNLISLNSNFVFKFTAYLTQEEMIERAI